MDKYERFFNATSPFLNEITRAIGKPIDTHVVNEIGHIVVGILDKGYEMCRQDHGEAVAFLADETYRKGTIAAFDGYTVRHHSTKYVMITDPDGKQTTFNLENLPEFSRIDRFHSDAICLRNDEDMAALAEQDSALHEALERISKIAEKLYWRKIAKAIERYHTASTRHQEARMALLKAGFSEDEVEGYIPEVDLKE